MSAPPECELRDGGLSPRPFSLPPVRRVTPKVAMILLPLMFAYDVFFVFLEPLIFGGPSVMVKAGGARLPFLLPSPPYLKASRPLFFTLRHRF